MGALFEQFKLLKYIIWTKERLDTLGIRWYNI